MVRTAKPKAERKKKSSAQKSPGEKLQDEKEALMTYSFLQASSITKASSSPEPPKDEVATPQIPKELFLQIVIAKLEDSKTCDWFELSKVINEKMQGLKDASKPANGVKYKKTKKGDVERWSGNELKELYQNVNFTQPGSRLPPSSLHKS